jgi:hypothetical protein
VTELAVIPKVPSGVRVVTRVTPLARFPTTWRNVRASNAGAPVVSELVTWAVLPDGRRTGGTHCWRLQ